MLFLRKRVKFIPAQTGGIFAALASNTAEAVLEAVQVAKKYGTVVAYDLNFRASLWKSQGGKEGAQRVNREIAKHVDVMIGNEEDFTAWSGLPRRRGRRAPDQHSNRILRQHDQDGGEGIPELQGGRHHPAQHQDRDHQRLVRHRSATTWKSTTASATASLPVWPMASWKARVRRLPSSTARPTARWPCPFRATPR